MEEARARELIAEARARIERALAGARPGEKQEELADVAQHMADDASELFDKELDEGLSIALQRELDAIERAEKRIEEGTYGISIESGKPIPDGRLEIVPWADRTAEEQARYEHST